MKISVRHVALLPLPLAGLAIAVITVASWSEHVPCSGERAGWIAGHLILAAFALFCVIAYWRIVTRRYLGVAMAAVWFGHLLVFEPFVVDSCSGHRNLHALRQAAGFGLEEFGIAAVAAALVASIALHLRYRRFVDVPPGERRELVRRMAGGGAALAVAIGALAWWLIPRLQETYAALGADLPNPTLMLIGAWPYWMIVPVACVGALGWIATMPAHQGDHLRLAANGAVAAIILLNVSFGVLVFSPFAPVMKLCSCV